MDDITNDNDAYPATARAREPDAHGQAALLLVESLLHGLIDSSVISIPEAVEIVEVAAEVEADLAVDRSVPPEAARHSRDLLAAIGSSLKHDG